MSSVSTPYPRSPSPLPPLLRLILDRRSGSASRMAIRPNPINRTSNPSHRTNNPSPLRSLPIRLLRSPRQTLEPRWFPRLAWLHPQRIYPASRRRRCSHGPVPPETSHELDGPCGRNVLLGQDYRARGVLVAGSESGDDVV